jgi:2-oxoglutarate dehydrogenase E1 component
MAQKLSPLGNLDGAAIEELYRQYRENPQSLDSGWVHFFAGFELAIDKKKDVRRPGQIIHRNRQRVQNPEPDFKLQEKGPFVHPHQPGTIKAKIFTTLDIENFGLGQGDLDTIFEAGSEIGLGPSTLRQIVQHLQDTYCESVGVEYTYMRDPNLISWLQTKMERSRNRRTFTSEQRIHIFDHLKQAVGFESFIHRKFVGQKRFSLEGTEALIPALDAIIEKGAEEGISEFVIGMAHRGRLNVLANIMKKPYWNIFREFFGKEYEGDIQLGDVKYHLGYENTIETDTGKKVRLSLLPNPSHLEAVGPIAQGMGRSIIDSRFHGDNNRLAPIVIHGDAAIAGQGVVYETVQMSQLNGYKTGGTIHIVINNQVGFTTNYLEARSSTYCTDVAKVNRAPVFHVNGDDVEALIYTVQLAIEFRQKFHYDVFIDILSYRKYGHNEGDEPRFTQPLLYKIISQHPNPRDVYAKKLEDIGVVSKEFLEQRIADYEMFLDDQLTESRIHERLNINNFLVDTYKQFMPSKNADLFEKINTGVPVDKLKLVAEQMFNLPKNKNFFKKALKIVEDRKQMVADNRLDWALCELLAYGSLVTDGYPVRLSGQDAQRGTFAHRHAVLVEEDTGEKYYPLNDLHPGQPHFHVFNSPLSEYAVLGFEYGYALAMPNVLTIWEAQFGDFSNVAQVIIDQYITSAAEKWGLSNGLVMYLPHGYEGQGPEHSSARIERYIAQATGNNIQLMNLTSPANFSMPFAANAMETQVAIDHFHTQKPAAASRSKRKLEDWKQNLRESIDDQVADPVKVKTVVVTSGKLFFHLKETRKN